MKQLIYSIILLFSSHLSYADCAGGGMDYWPKGATIKQNSIIMIEGYAADQSLIKGLNTIYRVYLESKSHKVPLTIVDTLSSEYWLSQAILKPSEDLKVGHEYKLRIYVSENRGNQFAKWILHNKPRRDIKWTVESGKDENAPKFSSSPKETDNLVHYYGCGPSIHVVFKYEIEENSEYLIKASVKAEDSDKTTVYYLIPKKNEVHVGHGMCSGAFKLKEGKQYQVHFELLDASGNESSEATEMIKFTVVNDNY